MSQLAKKYKPEFDYSYALGVFPVVELLTRQPKHVTHVFLHSSAVGSPGVAKITELCKANHIVPEVNDKLIAKISLKENVHAIAFFDKYKATLSHDSTHLVLVNPSDLGNIGTIIRTMLSFGVYDLALIRPAGDIFNPRTVRATMGALFGVRFEYFESFADYQAKYHLPVYTFMLDGGQELSNVKFEKPCALVFGNESSGLGSEFKGVGQSIFIGQTKETDSLNLSVAVGVVLYANFTS